MGIKLVRSEIINKLTSGNSYYNIANYIGLLTENKSSEAEEFPEHYFYNQYGRQSIIFNSKKKYGNCVYLTKRGWEALKSEIIPKKYEYMKANPNNYYNQRYKDMTLEQYTESIEKDIHSHYENLQNRPANEMKALHVKQMKIGKSIEVISEIIKP